MADQAAGRRDKFASLQDKLNPVKRDKFASLAARQEVTSLNVAENPSTSAEGPPRPDKFASLAAKQEQPTPAQETVLSAPKRDKFASMAQTTAKPRRDKFASMAQRDKFAGSPQESKVNEAPALVTEKTREERMKELEQRIHQRQNILKDLEKAEGQVWNLILLAGESAKKLTTLKVVDDDKSLSSISSKYLATLQQVHSLLSPHAKFVKAYQNHKEEAEAKNMYAARVETRLSQERRNVIEEFLMLEKQEESQEISNNNKRKREE